MAITLNELKAKYAAKAIASEVTVSEGTTKAIALPGLFGRSVAKTKEVSVSTASTIRGVLPVTTRRFEDIVMELNEKHNNQDLESFKNKTRVHMIANAVGVNLPSDEELEALYVSYIAEQEAQAEANAPEVTEELSDSTINKLAQAVAKMMDNAEDLKARRRAAATQKQEEVLLKTDEDLEEYMTEEPAKKVKKFQCSSKGCKKKVYDKGDACEACISTPVEEERETVPPTKPAKTGRRRLGRQAPLAE